MNKFLKISLFVLLVLVVIIGGLNLSETTKVDEEKKIEQKIEQTKSSFDHERFGENQLNSVHIQLGSILGKVAVNNGGVTLTEDDHKATLKEMKYAFELMNDFDYYPIEMANLLELLEKTNAYNEEKQLDIEVVEEMFNIVTNMPIDKSVIN